MPDSGGAIPAFLDGTRWAGAARRPLAGDASNRRYERLELAGGDTAVLMIAPRGTGEDVRRFLRIARHLRASGFSAPGVLKAETGAGLLLLEDLGDGLFARLAAADPAREEPLYAAAVEMLVALHRTAPPEGLVAMTPEFLAGATDLAAIWYAGFGEGRADAKLTALLEGAFAEVDGLTTVLVLRDFHAENLIWLPGRDGTARVGLLDFQDALLGHPAYDLVSLLQDARRDLAPGLAERMTRHYLDLTGRDAEPFAHAAALIGVQRNLRILGVFARLSLKAGKAGYLSLLPRVWGHLTTALSAPGLEAIRDRILGTMPPPADGHLERLARR